jgi:hypothetical protein
VHFARRLREEHPRAYVHRARPDDGTPSWCPGRIGVTSTDPDAEHGFRHIRHFCRVFGVPSWGVDPAGRTDIDICSITVQRVGPAEAGSPITAAVDSGLARAGTCVLCHLEGPAALGRAEPDEHLAMQVVQDDAGALHPGSRTNSRLRNRLSPRRRGGQSLLFWRARRSRARRGSDAHEQQELGSVARRARGPE